MVETTIMFRSQLKPKLCDFHGISRVARFFWYITKTGKNVPNGHEISLMSVKYSKWT
jgi:hypothetical protein